MFDKIKYITHECRGLLQGSPLRKEVGGSQRIVSKGIGELHT